MIHVVMDTSALISLGMIDTLRKAAEITKITVPLTVKHELEEIEKYKNKEGRAARNVLQMIRSKQISITRIKTTKKVDSLLSKDINRGEAECFVCCLENNIKILVMDDVDAAYGLEGLAIANSIKIKISAAVLVELHRQKLIDKRELKKSIRDLVKIREWEGGALEVLAKKYLEGV